MPDLFMIETGNGGDAVLNGNDLAIVYGIENQPYLGMFGGNDWWGNSLFIPEQPLFSRTETALNTTPLNSNGRQKILQAVNADMAYIKAIPEMTVTTNVIIENDDRVKIVIQINGKTIQFLWNPNLGLQIYNL